MSEARMNDKTLTWSVWLTAVCLILFAGVALKVSGAGVREDIAICGQRQNEIDKHLEVLRMQVLQLEEVNKSKLKRQVLADRKRKIR